MRPRLGVFKFRCNSSAPKIVSEVRYWLGREAVPYRDYGHAYSPEYSPAHNHAYCCAAKNRSERKLFSKVSLALCLTGLLSQAFFLEVRAEVSADVSGKINEFEASQSRVLDQAPLILESQALGEAVYAAGMGDTLQASTYLMVAAARGEDKAQLPQRVLYLSSLLWQMGLTDQAASLLEAGVANVPLASQVQMMRVQQARMALAESGLYAWDDIMGALTPPANPVIAQAVNALRVQFAAQAGDWTQAEAAFATLPPDDLQSRYFFQDIFIGHYQAGDVGAWQQWLGTGLPGVFAEDKPKKIQIPLADDSVGFAQYERWILQKAFAAVSNQSYELAMSYFDQIRSKSPWLVEALFGKVMLFLRQTQVDEAFETWRIMLERTPDDLQMLTAGLLVAQAFEAQTAFDDALLVLDAQVPYLNEFRKSLTLLQDKASALPLEAPPTDWHPVAQRYWHDLAADPVWQKAVQQWNQLKLAERSVQENKRRLHALRTAFEWQQTLRAQKASVTRVSDFRARRAALMAKHRTALTQLELRLLAWGDLALASPETQSQWALVNDAFGRLDVILAVQPDYPDAVAARQRLEAARGLLLWQAYEDSLDRSWRVVDIAQENEAALEKSDAQLARITEWVEQKRDLNISEQKLDRYAEKLTRLEGAIAKALVKQERSLIERQVAFVTPMLAQLTQLEQDIRFAAARVADAHWAARQDDVGEVP